MKKIVLTISICANLVFILCGFVFIYQKGGVDFIRQKFISTESYYSAKVQTFNTLPDETNRIVLIGDSLTEFGPWNEFLDGYDVVNRGINGDTSKGVMDRIEVIAESGPSHIFIMVGTNDLKNGVKANEILSNIENTVQTIKDKSPSTKIYIQSILPYNSDLYVQAPNYNSLKKINVSLVDLSQELGVTYIDVEGALSTDGVLEKKYTYDGLHLKGDAYKIWADMLKQHMN